MNVAGMDRHFECSDAGDRRFRGGAGANALDSAEYRRADCSAWSWRAKISRTRGRTIWRTRFTT